MKYVIMSVINEVMFMKKITFKTVFKSFFLIAAIFGITLIPDSAQAKTYKIVGASLSDISTSKPMEEYVTIQVPPQKIFGSDIFIKNDAMFRAKVIKIQPARRGKLDGYIDALLVAYAIPSEGNKTIDISERNLVMRIKLYSETDFKGLAESAATTVVSHVFDIPFLSQGVAVVKGAAMPIEGESRIKSAGIGLYESTPLAYASKGKELEAQRGTKLTLSFKVDELNEEQSTPAQSEPSVEAPQSGNEITE